jgi:hypothetical protein
MSAGGVATTTGRASEWTGSQEATDMPAMSVPLFERFFRSVAGLDLDKSDLKRFSDFVRQKTHDLLVVAEAAAKANGRDVIVWRDLPITHGLERSIHDFQRIDKEIELRPVLEQLATLPPLNLGISEETQARLPTVVGGLSVALGRTLTIIDPKVRNPATEHWERAFRIFDLLL